MAATITTIIVSQNQIDRFVDAGSASFEGKIRIATILSALISTSVPNTDASTAPVTLSTALTSLKII